MQEPVLERRALHMDEVGELEYALERARRDALVKHIALRLCLRLLVTADCERALLGLDLDIGFGEASDRDRDAILVIAGALDVVVRVARCTVMAGDLIKERALPVKADGRTIEGS